VSSTPIVRSSAILPPKAVTVSSTPKMSKPIVIAGDTTSIIVDPVASVQAPLITLSGSCTTSMIGTINVSNQSYSVVGGSKIDLSDTFSINTTNASKIVVSMYDRDNYAGVQTKSYGTLSDDIRYSYKASSYSIAFALRGGEYVATNGMKFNDLGFTASNQENRVQTIDVLAYNSRGLMVDNRTVDVVTRNSYVDLTPGWANGAEIAAMATSFIGQNANYNGCWNLASTITASCGVSLDQKTANITSNIYDNGQQQVVYNSGKGVNLNWMDGLIAGDQVEFGWSAGGGHIATVNRVTDGQAFIVDNSGAFVNNGTGTDKKIIELALGSYAPYINQAKVNVYRANETLAPAGAGVTGGTSGAAGSAPTSTTGSIAWNDFVGLADDAVASNLVDANILGKNQGTLVA